MVLALPLRGKDPCGVKTPSSHMPVVASVPQGSPCYVRNPQNDTAPSSPCPSHRCNAPLPLTRAYRGVPLGERVLFSKHSVYKVLSWPFWLSSFRFLAESQKGLCLTVVIR